MASKDILIQRLENLLGFDGADDVLEHLLTIESKQVRVSSVLVTWC
jgi:hypothetical protein